MTTVDIVKPCTVIVEWIKDPKTGDYKICGKPIAGYRGEWPMCAEHMELFKPEEPYDQDAE